MPNRLVLLGTTCLLTLACGSDTPSRPATDAVSVTSVSPAPGSIVTVPGSLDYIVPGGVALPPGSGLISVGVDMTSGRTAPWAQLNVYLLTGGTTTEYCGQNTPDSPTWPSLTPGWTTSHTVTGFRVYNLPCEVTGVRVMLHTRNSGLLTPPTAGETIAEAVVPAGFLIRR